MAARGIIGAGDIYFARFTAAGVPGPYVFASDGTKFSVKPNSTIKERKSRGRDDYGQIAETTAQQEPAEFAVTLADPTNENFAFAVMGTLSTATQTVTTITDEVIVASLGRHVPLAHQDINPVGIVVTNSGGTTTYVEGTDYVVNQRLGTLRALPGGAITEAQSLRVDYSTLAATATVIDGGTVASIRAAVLFDGINIVDNSKLICHVWEAVLTPSGEVDLLADDWMGIELSGRMKKPADKPGPYRIIRP